MAYKAVKLMKHADGVDGLVLEVDGLWKGVLGWVVDGYEALANCGLLNRVSYQQSWRRA